MHANRLHVFGIVVAGLLAALTACRTAAAAESAYRLSDMYRLALERSETIDLARQQVQLARTARKKALSVLVPRLDSFAGVTRYDRATLSQPDWSASWGVTASQRVTLNGRELTALHIADQGIDKSRLELDAATEAYLFEVTGAYYDVLRAMEALDIAEANETRLEVQRDSVQARLELEEVAKTDLLRVQAELSRAVSERIRVANLLTLARSVLGRVVGIPGPFETKPPADGPPDLLAAYDPAQLTAEALDTRPELDALRMQEKIAADRVRFARGAFWPAVEISGRYVGTETQPRSPAVTADSFSVTGQLTFTVFDGGRRRADVTQARIQARLARLARQDLEKSIAIEVETVVLELRTQQGVLRSLADQLRFAASNYEAVSKQFEYGLATSVDLIDANTLLATSQLELSEARIDYDLAQLKLQRVKGTFLPTITAALDEPSPGASGEPHS